MIAISFLGTSEYKPVKYSFENLTFETPFFQEFIAKKFEPKRIIVFMTEKAKSKNGEKLSALLKTEEIIIPEGNSENEIWDIFSILTENLPENEEYIVDITHGFRSLPVLAIASMLYLRTLKNVEIKKLLYGAYEARDTETNIAPVFDLTQFINIIDWTYAVNDFINKGDMSGFKDLLNSVHNLSHINKSENRSKKLKSAGTALSELTDAFNTIRLEQILETAQNFQKMLPELSEDFKNQIGSKPFGYLVDKINEKLLPLSQAEGKLFSDLGYEAQKSIIKWYLDTEQYQKALTLAREFIISRYMMVYADANDKEKIQFFTIRENYKDELNNGMKLAQQHGHKKDGKGIFYELWEKVIELRNDVNHAGMKKSTTKAGGIINNTKGIIPRIIEEL